MDFNNITELLKNGVNPEDIAKAFTDELNDAIKENQKKDSFSEACANFADAWREVLYAWDPTADFSDLYFDGEQVEDALQTIIDLYDMTKVYLNNIKNIGKPKQATAPVKKNTASEADFDEVMRRFLDTL